MYLTTVMGWTRSLYDSGSIHYFNEQCAFDWTYAKTYTDALICVTDILQEWEISTDWGFHTLEIILVS